MKHFLFIFFFTHCFCQWSNFNSDPESSVRSDNPGEFTFDLSQFKKCDDNCYKCDSGVCKQCNKGFFLYKSVCYEACPFDTFADNYSLTCKTLNQTPVFIKAYTISRCLNSCGKTFEDCSCSPKCKKFGDCCSDYKFCDIIESEKSTKCKIENCKFCSQDGNNCLQCKDNFYYFENKCVLKCPKDLNQFESNKVCYHKCGDVNCEKCEENNKGNCLKCLNGFFLFKGECLKTCPIETRANKIDFTCNSKKEFSFYWTFPSKSSCKDKCGVFEINNDCSCRVGCMRRGNCCDDFEKECSEELQKEGCKLCQICLNGSCIKCKELAILSNNGICKCDRGFFYDFEEDVCIRTNLNNQRYYKLKKLEKKMEERSQKILPKHNEKKHNIIIPSKKLIKEEKNEPKEQNKIDLSESFDFFKKLEVKKEVKNKDVNVNIKPNSAGSEFEDTTELDQLNGTNLKEVAKKTDSKPSPKTNLKTDKVDKIKNDESAKKLNITNVTLNKAEVNISSFNNTKILKNKYKEVIEIKTQTSDRKIHKQVQLKKLEESKRKNRDLVKVPQKQHFKNETVAASNVNNLASELLTYFNNIMKLLEKKNLQETDSRSIRGIDSNTNQIMNLYMNGNISINILEGTNHSTLNANKIISMNSNNNLSSNSLFNNSYNTNSTKSISDNLHTNRNSGQMKMKENPNSKRRFRSTKNSPHIVSLLSNIKTLNPHIQLKTSFDHVIPIINKKRNLPTSRDNLMQVIKSLSKRRNI